MATAAAGLIPAAAQATALTWNGGGVDNNWSTVFNWSPAQAPVSGDSLTFDGFGRLTNSNDIAGLTINGVEGQAINNQGSCMDRFDSPSKHGMGQNLS